jgi:MSHA biogenesis protein MshQ
MVNIARKLIVISACLSIIPAAYAEQCFTQRFLGAGHGIDDSWQILAADGFTPAPVTVGSSNRLRLTDANQFRVGGVSKDYPIPSSGITEFEFTAYAWGGDGADGISFVLSDWNVAPDLGGDGGSLGYAFTNRDSTYQEGFAGGWIGVGIDEYGNYVNFDQGRNGGVGFMNRDSLLYLCVCVRQ